MRRQIWKGFRITSSFVSLLNKTRLKSAGQKKLSWACLQTRWPELCAATPRLRTSWRHSSTSPPHLKRSIRRCSLQPGSWTSWKAWWALISWWVWATRLNTYASGLLTWSWSTRRFLLWRKSWMVKMTDQNVRESPFSLIVWLHTAITEELPTMIKAVSNFIKNPTTSRPFQASFFYISAKTFLGELETVFVENATDYSAKSF